jgi:hypothetical protein
MLPPPPTQLALRGLASTAPVNIGEAASLKEPVEQIRGDSGRTPSFSYQPHRLRSDPQREAPSANLETLPQAKTLRRLRETLAF